MKHDFTLLRLGSVARQLCVSPRTVRRLVAAGALPAVRVGRQLRFDPSAVADFIAKGGGA